MSDLKFIPPPEEDASEVVYKISRFGPHPLNKGYCRHIHRIMDETNHSIYCADCSATLSLFAECRSLLDKVKKSETDKAAMKEWYSETAVETRKRVDFERDERQQKEERRYDRMRACGVKVTRNERGWYDFEYPVGWSGLRDAEAAKKKYRGSK